MPITLDVYVQLVYNAGYGSTDPRLIGSLPVERIAADLYAVHAAVSEPRRVLGLLEGTLPSRRFERVPAAVARRSFTGSRARAAYSCQYCRHQVYPTAGTIFHKSTTNLQMWFWAIFLMSSTRCGISAKQLERETRRDATRRRIGCSSRFGRCLDKTTAIRCDGEVEVDETCASVGKPRGAATPVQACTPATCSGQRNRGSTTTCCSAMVERGGRVQAEIVKQPSAPTISRTTMRRARPTVGDDLHGRLDGLPSRRGQARTSATSASTIERTSTWKANVHTNTIEGFFGLWKNGVRGVYHAISAEYLQDYLDEYTWRYNHRHDERPMFDSILDRVQREDLASA